MNNRIGLGIGKGRGYYNLVPIKDSYVHSLSSKGIKITYVPSKVLCDFAGMNNFAARQIHFHPRPKKDEVFIDRDLSKKDKIKTILHETTEIDLMRHGHPYWSAHKVALKKEDELYSRLRASKFNLDEFMVKDGKNVWSSNLNAKANIQAPKKIMQELKTPTVEVLPAKTFDTKFKDDYEEYEQGYATTKISPDGTTRVYVRDDGNGDYTKEGKLLMHELKEIEIFKDLVNNKGVNANIADEMAHNMNPVKIDGVSDQYPIDPNN
jgi:hypothetical protein